MIDAMEFLQHIRECCYRNINCRNCPVYHHTENPKNILEDGYCRLDRLALSTDEEIADIIQDVEKWGKENGWWIEDE